MRWSWIALAAVLAGCTSLPSYMRAVDPVRQLKAPGDRALVVFVRRSTANKAIAAHLMDDQANFLGTALAGSHFSVLRPPGKQSFVVWSEAEDILVAELAPGLVYFVEVIPAMGVIRTRFTLRASRRGSEIHPYQEKWLEGTVEYWVDATAAREQMAEQLEARRETLRDAADRLKEYAGLELADHTLAQADGHSQPGVPGTVRYAAAAPVAAPAPVPVAVAVQPARVPAPAPEEPAGFVPEAFPTPTLAPGEIPRGYPRGSVVRVKLKDGTILVGEVKNETRVDLKIIVGANAHLFDFVEIESIERLAPAK